MKNLDLYSKLSIQRAISPVSVSDNTAQVSQIIDRQGFTGLLFGINIGSVADADATFAVLVEDGDEADLSDNAAVAAQAADVPEIEVQVVNTLTDDVVFQGVMGVGNYSDTYDSSAPVTYSFDLSTAAAPSVDDMSLA